MSLIVLVCVDDPKLVNISVCPQELQGSSHDRSLLERCVAASGTVHCLEEQYRMPESICKIVSKLFYDGLLRTPPQVSIERRHVEKHPSLPPLLFILHAIRYVFSMLFIVHAICDDSCLPRDS